MTVLHRAGGVWSGMFDFQKGAGLQKKFFVLLTNCVANGPDVLMAFATSKGVKQYAAGAMSTSPCGCPSHSFFRIEAGQEPCFSVQTWIGFNNTRTITPTKLVAIQGSGDAVFEQMLADDRIRSMLRCATKSIDIAKRDIAVIEATLKPLVAAAKTAPKPPTPLESIRGRYERRCTTCRASILGLMMISEVELVAICSGANPEPTGFIGDLEAGFAALDACACGK